MREILGLYCPEDRSKPVWSIYLSIRRPEKTGGKFQLVCVQVLRKLDISQGSGWK
jgi:hypothetical protein